MKITRRHIALGFAGAVIAVAAGGIPAPGGTRRSISQLGMVDPEYAPPQEPTELKRQKLDILTKPEGGYPSISRER